MSRSDFYYLGYSSMVDGYRHAYEREVPGSRIGRTEIKTTRNPNHPPDPKCPGCVEVKCPECGASTHPSLSPCIHQPDGPEWDERMRALYRKAGLRFR